MTAEPLMMFPNGLPETFRVKKRGHMGQPGKGPEGETCKSCAHYTRRHFAKVYRKCGLTEKTWTNGPGTDIRAGDPACEFWVDRVRA